MLRFTSFVALLFVAGLAPAGELVAGIELGGKGVKGTVVEYDPASPSKIDVESSTNTHRLATDGYMKIQILG